jgi:hypothetical protein
MKNYSVLICLIEYFIRNPWALNELSNYLDDCLLQVIICANNRGSKHPCQIQILFCLLLIETNRVGMGTFFPLVCDLWTNS